jgi:hypothetical protein
MRGVSGLSYAGEPESDLPLGGVRDGPLISLGRG